MALKVFKQIWNSDVVGLWRSLRSPQPEAPPAMQSQWSALDYKVVAIHISDATPGGID